jgi:hypothetical protein
MTLVGKSEGKRPLRCRRMWDDNTNRGLRELGRGGINCINLGQDKDMWRAFVHTVMNLRVP